MTNDEQTKAPKLSYSSSQRFNIDSFKTEISFSDINAAGSYKLA